MRDVAGRKCWYNLIILVGCLGTYRGIEEARWVLLGGASTE